MPIAEQSPLLIENEETSHISHPVFVIILDLVNETLDNLPVERGKLLNLFHRVLVPVVDVDDGVRLEHNPACLAALCDTDTFWLEFYLAVLQYFGEELGCREGPLLAIFSLRTPASLSKRMPRFALLILRILELSSVWKRKSCV